MATMTVLVTGKGSADFPAIMEAARCLPKARALKCDRIRVEALDGARVADYTTAAVERYVTEHQLILQPDRIALRDRDWEYRRPVFQGWSKGDS